MIVLYQKGYLWANWSDLRDKSIWMILDLLIVPLSLATFIFILDKLERNEERKLNLDNQRERLIQNYISDITGLILENKLKESKRSSDVEKIAHFKTLATLKRLDIDRKNLLMEFIHDTYLIQGEHDHPKISLQDANLEDVDPNWFHLHSSVFFRANLKRAIMAGCNLVHAKMSGANLEKANFMDSTLHCALLVKANMKNANLERATLSEANILGACLKKANLGNANLDDATLTESNMKGAKMKGAQIDGTKFKDTTMPDGKNYDPEIHTIEYLTGRKNIYEKFIKLILNTIRNIKDWMKKAFFDYLSKK
jgi:uncharacterized protein YjbI with pentapeptide repeats